VALETKEALLDEEEAVDVVVEAAAASSQ